MPPLAGGYVAVAIRRKAFWSDGGSDGPPRAGDDPVHQSGVWGESWEHSISHNYPLQLGSKVTCYTFPMIPDRNLKPLAP